jgi:hypothetical protein
MEAEMFSVWSLRWLYNEYEVSFRESKESREWEYNGTQLDPGE